MIIKVAVFTVSENTNNTEAGGQNYGLVQIGKNRNPVGVNGKLQR